MDEWIKKVYCEDSCRFNSLNEATLLAILEGNRDTDIGRRFDFGSIDSEAAYRLALPLTDYSYYASGIEQMKSGGEKVFTAFPIYAYPSTSGTMGKQKIFPLTEKSLDMLGSRLEDYCGMIAGHAKESRLFISMLRTDFTKKQSEVDDTILSGAYYRFGYERGYWDPGSYCGGSALCFFNEREDVFFIKLWISFAKRDIITFETIFLYDMLLFLRYMERNWETVLTAMEERRIPPETKVSPEKKRLLLSMEVDSERLSEIRRECRAGFENIAQRLWPCIRLISGIGSETTRIEERFIKRYTGRIDVWHFSYVSTECFMGICTDIDSYQYILLPHQAYYEFLPLEGGEPVTVSELVTGRDYSPVVTTYSGLYRYRMDDVVRIRGFFGENPVIEFMYRKNLLLNIAGEKLDERTLEVAVWRLSQRLELPIVDFMYGENYEDMTGRYELFLLLDAVPFFEGELSARCADVMDSILMELSPDYEDLRLNYEISRINVRLCSAEEFEAVRKTGKKKNAHEKPVHMIRG